MVRVPHVKEFIDLVAAHPPFAANPRGLSGGNAVIGSRRIRKTA
jgi:hypothetical protein